MGPPQRIQRLTLVEQSGLEQIELDRSWKLHFAVSDLLKEKIERNGYGWFTNRPTYGGSRMGIGHIFWFLRPGRCLGCAANRRADAARQSHANR
jgi:hypothetical protein